MFNGEYYVGFGSLRFLAPALSLGLLEPIYGEVSSIRNTHHFMGDISDIPHEKFGNLLNHLFNPHIIYNIINYPRF